MRLQKNGLVRVVSSDSQAERLMKAGYTSADTAEDNDFPVESEKNPENAEESPENAEESPENVEESPESVEESPESAVKAEDGENDGRDKGKGSRKAAGAAG